MVWLMDSRRVWLVSRSRGWYALRAERDPARINVESVPPRFPRDLDDPPLILSQLQPLQRLFNRTKPGDERVLLGHTSFRLRHLLYTINNIPTIKWMRKNSCSSHSALKEKTRKKRRSEGTYRVFRDLAYKPSRQILSTPEPPQMRMPRRPIKCGNSDWFCILRR